MASVIRICRSEITRAQTSIDVSTKIPLSRRQSCSYEGSNTRQRVSIQSCILENKHLTRVIAKRAAMKHTKCHVFHVCVTRN